MKLRKGNPKRLIAIFTATEKIPSTSHLPPEIDPLLLQRAVERGTFEPTPGTIRTVFTGPCPVILCGCRVSKPFLGFSETESDTDAAAVFQAGSAAAAFAKREGFSLLELHAIPDGFQEAAFRGAAAASYSYSPTKNRRRNLEVLLPNLSPVRKRRLRSVVTWEDHIRDWVNTIPARKPPLTLAQRMRKVLSRPHVRTRLWRRRDLERSKCRGILAVGGGSDNPPVVLTAHYTPPKSRGRIALVGKGVTFDSGGLNVKTAEGMKTMKCDMAGAALMAAVFGASVEAGLPWEMFCFLGFAENLPSGKAYKPGDVITMRSGKRVEVLNTDAEGRILLGDLLDLALERKPDLILDAATLTGACMVALGETTGGFFTRSRRLAEEFLSHSECSGEAFWALPLGRCYDEAIKGEEGRIKNTGGRYGGASTAAAFLEKFVGSVPWIHLDIAGPAFLEKGACGWPRGATGFGLMTTLRFLEELSPGRLRKTSSRWKR